MEKLLGCPHKDHQKSQISHICTKKGCDNPSRVVCSKCVRCQSHPHYDHFLDISEIFKYQKGDYIENWPQNLEKIYYFDKDAQIEEMEKQFDALGEKITQNILAAKKECKIQILKQVRKFDELKQRLDKDFNLEPLKQAVLDYQNSKLSIKQLNKRIQEFSDRDCIKNSEKEIWQMYNNQNVKEIDLESFKIVENQIADLFQNLPNKVLRKNYKFTFEAFESDSYVQVDEKQKNIVKSIEEEGSELVRSIQTFEGKEKVQFKLKFNKNPYSALILGFATENQIIDRDSEYFWLDSGIQLNLYQNDSQNKGKFVIQRGNISIEDLCQKKDVVYEIEICVEEKLFVIRNKKNNFEMKWQGDFQPEVNQKWVLLLGGNTYEEDFWELQVL